MTKRINSILRTKADLKEKLKGRVSEGIYRFFVCCLLIVGCFCLFAPQQAYLCLPFLFGIPLATGGVIGITASIRLQEYQTKDTKMMSVSILSFLLGTVIMVAGSKADGLIGSIWGVFGLAKASEELNEIIYEIFAHGKWKLKLIVSCVEILLALSLLFDPFQKVRSHVIILGIENLVLAKQFHDEHKEKEKAGRSSISPAHE